MTTSKHRRQIRYAVVGLGHIAQVAVLPAFAHARKNSRLTALVSGDPEKLKTLGRRYHVDHLFSYREYDDCLRSGMVDAVYIVLPNHRHADYSIRAARAGIHVLCEKPMAVTERECRAMIQAAERAGIKLMIAYRLHFEEANMTAVRIVRSGKLGNPRFFTSSFSMQVRPDNIRTDKDKGGGTLYDIGIYCINAARYLFGAEPTEVFAFSSANKKDPRFKEIDEMTSALLRFPDGRLAAFSSSFGAADVASYRMVGTRGCDSTKLTSTFIPSSSMSRSRAKPGSKPFANEISLRPSWSTSPVVFLTTRLQNRRGPKESRMCALSKRCIVRQNADERSKSNRYGKRKGL